MCFKTAVPSVSKTTEFANNQLIVNNFKLIFFRTVADIRRNFAPDKTLESFQNFPIIGLPNDFFLNLNYLETVERTPPTDYSFAYLVIQNAETDKIAGFMACQIKYFDAAKSFNFKENNLTVFDKLKINVQKLVAKLTRFSTLIIGNLTLTGQHSFYFNDAEINDFEVKKRLYTEGVSFLKKQLLETYKIKIASVFVKDFYQDSADYTLMQALKSGGYNEFQVEPNFVFDIKPEWQNFDNYLEVLGSKYRVRVKRAFKKLGNNVEKKEFFEARILANQLAINGLYGQVSGNSGFNLVDLHADYFPRMKTDLGDNFRLFGYFLDQKLIGFYTTISNGEELEAHFLGYEASLNHEHQVYLNMLFDIIRLGIEGKFKKIIFSRTAHEIKSSIGAEPVEMSLFMRHDNLIVNRLLPYILKVLSPREKWTPRTPFK
ncbi:MAG: hypothetical protein U5L45_17085 [Saprospiraceae bacterium]|nr:hypothetical protein [Saprospiraceae bacterium]